jgi:hypothetical protein
MASIDVMLSEERLLCTLDIMKSLSSPPPVTPRSAASTDVSVYDEVKPTDLSSQVEALEETVDIGSLDHIDPGADPLRPFRFDPAEYSCG